jgi:hypothetical protein
MNQIVDPMRGCDQGVRFRCAFLMIGGSRQLSMEDRIDSSSIEASSTSTSPGSTQSMQLANANILRSSIGVGLTWGSPFGALTVNYAVPVTKAAYDVVQPFNFSASRSEHRSIDQSELQAQAVEETSDALYPMRQVGFDNSSQMP